MLLFLATTPISIRSESPDRLRLPPGRPSIVAAAPPLPRVRSRDPGVSDGFWCKCKRRGVWCRVCLSCREGRGVKDDSVGLFYWGKRTGMVICHHEVEKGCDLCLVVVIRLRDLWLEAWPQLVRCPPVSLCSLQLIVCDLFLCCVWLSRRLLWMRCHEWGSGVVFINVEDCVFHFPWSWGIDGEMVKGMSWKLGFLPEVGCMEF